MTIIDLTTIKFSNNRAELRSQIINVFLKEAPGSGKNELTSRYRYITKKLNDGREVYLSRPANFNNGFDFTLNVSSTNFNAADANKRSSTRPTHSNIFDDLNKKYNENPELYNSLIEQVELIYQCKEPTLWHLDFKEGHPTELILECIKWLFVEQDVTYWNYSGRGMFYNGIVDL